nr:hypothetical protein [Tanacetum cinerariifolium]
MRELKRKLFRGADDEDAHEHVKRVLEIADLFHFLDVTRDAVMVRLFPITLKGPALRWKSRLSAGSITTWYLLEKAFIRQYCSSFKTGKILEEIHNFKPEMDEPLYHAWERYSDLLYKCLRHDMNSQQKRPDIKMGKKDMKELIPRDLPVVPLMCYLRYFQDICMDKRVTLSKLMKLFVCKKKAHEKERGMDDGWDVTLKDVERLRHESAGGKHYDKNAKESWALLEDLSLYNNERWNDPSNFAKSVKTISLPQDVLSTTDSRLIELENQVQRLMEAHLAPKQPIQDISSVIDPRLSQVVLGKPFVEVSNRTHDLSLGIVRNEEDKRRGVDYVMSKILVFYKECMELGPEYLSGLEDEEGVT